MHDRLAGLPEAVGRRLPSIAAAAIMPIVLTRSLPAFPIETQCTDCGDFPWWVQAILTLVGLGIAMVILYVPYRLSVHVSSPRWRALVRWGGILLLTVGLVALARLAVLVLPDN